MTEESQQPEPGVGKLVRITPGALPERQSIADLEQAFALAVRQRELLSDYIKKQLKPGKHFYEIKGQENKKPSLAKEGAEIILLPHNYTPDYEHLGGPLEPPEGEQPYQITVKCILRRKGEPDSFVGSGIGSAGSHKGKWQDKKFIYVPRQRDRYLCHNATLKMAQKSAMVSATINATAASEFFTTDLEESIGHDRPEASAEPAAKPAPAKPAVKATPKTRAWFLDKLRESFDEPTLLSYAVARGYLEGEGLESWALDKVLLKRTEIAKLQADILEFVKSGKTKAKPKANGKTLPTSPQGQLATLCTAAGFSFDEFSDWAIDHGNLEPDKFTSFDDLPTDAAEFFVEGFKGILKQLQAARGQNEPPVP
jgi:hypothetical protein